MIIPKKISQDVVGITVLWALLDQEKVTTLEVKNYLRSKGYRITQEEISKLVTDYVDMFARTGQFITIDDKHYTIAFDVKTATGPGVTASYREYKLRELGADTTGSIVGRAVARAALPVRDEAHSSSIRRRVAAMLYGDNPAAATARAANAPVSTNTPTSANAYAYIAGETIGSYVARNHQLSSQVISEKLLRYGIHASARSIAAYKANLNR